MAIPRFCGVLATAGLLLACGGGDDEDEETFGFGPMSTGTAAEDGSGGDDGSGGGDGGTADSGSDGDPTGGEDDDGPDDSGGDAEPEGPHARGTIVIGETHGVGGSMSTPSVTASFVPDYTTPQECGQMISGCMVSGVPTCGAACLVDETCGFNDQCQSECQAVCSLPCAVGQVCYFPAPGAAPACKAEETFDAGPLSFAGTTAPVTLFPPYAYSGVPSGSLYLPGNPITVNASGAAEATAGFDAFDRDFVATAYVTTGLELVDPNVAYGDGPVPVTWQPGSDDLSIVLNVTSELGNTGTIRCLVDDASGTFDVPRAAIVAPLVGDPLQTLTVGVERRRTEYRGGLTTHGTLTDATVQADGYLELVTTSRESATIQNCGLLTWCETACVDTQTNPAHCGGCGIPCTELQACSLGICS